MPAFWAQVRWKAGQWISIGHGLACIALNPDRQIRSLVCSEFYVSPQYRGMFWQPFDPLKTETLPDLKHYGIEFTNYIAALRSQDVK